MGKKTVYPGRLEAVEALEAKAKKEIKGYFSDWTDYDRPELLDKEKTPDGSEVYLLTRTCGSYLLNPAQRPISAAAILEYYQTQSGELQKLRKIRLTADAVTVETADPDRTLEAWKPLARAAEEAEKKAKEVNAA